MISVDNSYIEFTVVLERARAGPSFRRPGRRFSILKSDRGALLRPRRGVELPVALSSARLDEYVGLDPGDVVQRRDQVTLLAHLEGRHIAAAGLDVLAGRATGRARAQLLRLYPAREPLLEGRLIVTPHAPPRLTSESETGTRRKSAHTMRAALLTKRRQNVITPQMC